MDGPYYTPVASAPEEFPVQELVSKRCVVTFNKAILPGRSGISGRIHRIIHMTLKQKLGKIILPVLPLNRRTFDVIRFELDAALTRMLSGVSPRSRKARRDLARRKHLRVNVGSGGEGSEGWINIDVHRHHKDQTLPWDIRYSLPFEDNQVVMMLAEHVVEHLEFREDIPRFFSEVYRVLEAGGYFRIVVPDGERWAKAYVSRDPSQWKALGLSELPDDMPTPMAMLNHIFHQGGEHQFAWDFETINYALRAAGFGQVYRRSFRESGMDELAIDLPHHAPYSLYVEAIK